MTEAAIGEALKVLVVTVALPLSWIVSVALLIVAHRASQAAFVPGPLALRARRGLDVLRVQVVFSLAVSLIVTVFAVVFVNNDLKVPFLTPDQTRILTRGSLLVLVVVPAGYWIRLVVRRLKGEDDEPGRVAHAIDRVRLSRLVHRMDQQDVRQDEQDGRMDEQDEKIDKA